MTVETLESAVRKAEDRILKLEIYFSNFDKKQDAVLISLEEIKLGKTIICNNHTNRMDEFERRITAIKGTQASVIKAVIGIVVTLISTFIAHIFGKV